MKQIILWHDYVSQQSDITELFLTKTKNLYLKKGSTGIGGTTTILEATDSTRIVVSPTVGMIQGKEKQKAIKNKNCFFIYANSTHTWNDFLACTENKVVNCTPEQIIKLKTTKPTAYKWLITNTIFIDEIHQYIPDSSYRTSMKEFLKIIFQDWKANWILSTATDNTILNHLLDIPPGILYDSYEIIKPNRQIKNIEVLKSPTSLEINKVKEVLNDSISRGRKLLVATNKSSIHKKLAKLEGFKVINLVGENIAVKMRTHKQLDKIEDIDWQATDLIVISSKYFAGFDIPLDVDILIDVNPKITNTLISTNEIRQIIGRARLNVGRIVLFISYKEPLEESKIRFQPSIICTTYNDVIETFKERLNDLTEENWYDNIDMMIADWSYYTLIFQQLLKSELMRYGYNIIPYTNATIENILSIEKYQFNKQLQFLVQNIDEQQLYHDFFRITKYLKYKIDGIFKPELAMLFYTAIQIKKLHLEIDFSKSIKPSRFYPTLNKYLNKNWRWNCLYGWFKTELEIKGIKNIPQHAQFDKQLLDYLEVRSLPRKEDALESNTYIELYIKSVEIIREKKLTIDIHEDGKLLSRCREVFSYQNIEDFKGFKTKDQLLKIAGWANLFILNGGRESYNFPIKRNRTYNPLTQLPSQLRKMVNTNLIEIDIKQANPTFIDGVIGSNIASNIYDNIQKAYNITRDEAKIKYNTILNNEKGDQLQIYEFFTKIGYTKDQSAKLTGLVKAQKGAVYDAMTKKEKEIIEFIAEMHLPNCNWFRFHDAIIVVEAQHADLVRALPEEVMDVKLGFKYYNTGEEIVNDIF